MHSTGLPVPVPGEPLHTQLHRCAGRQEMCWTVPGCALGEVTRTWLLMSRAGTGLRPSSRVQGMGREAASPSTFCQKRVGKGEHPHPLQMEPHTQGSPSGSAVGGTRRRGVGLWPHCGRGFRCSHLQVPPFPEVSSLAVIDVGVWQPSGRLGAGLHCLHPLLQAAAREHHIAGADTLGLRLPQVLLAVPDAVAEVDNQA